MEPTPDKAPAGESDDPSKLHIWQIQAVRDVLLVAALLAILWLGYAMSAITVPLLLALGLAYLFEPVIDRIQRLFRWSRTAAVSLILALFLLGVVTVVVPTVFLVIGQTSSFISSAANGRYADLLDKGVTLLPKEMRTQAEDGISWLEEKMPWSARVFGDAPATDAPADVDAASSASGKTAAPTAPAPVSEAEDARIERMVRDEVARQLSGGLELDPVAAERRERAKKFGASALGVVGAGARQVWGLVLGSIELGLLVFLVPFYFFYFATSYPRVLAFGSDFIPDHNRARVEHLVREMDRAVAGFVRGRLVISAILGTIFAIGWLIVGVPYSLALGLLVGVFCAVPYLSVIGVPVAVTLLAVDQFSLPESERMVWWGILVWPTAVYMLGQTLDDWVLTPLIQGKVTNLNPVAIVVAVLAGGTLAGIYGMLLAVPAAACVKIILSEVFMPRIQAWRRGRVSDPLPVG
ncbi:MAG: hypothetical protein CMJ52_00905 [Planctomycetaceae bacterium]|nr:hypothetical protein [Planctomycetaceae bacterium]